jgi:hypothetical protein
MKRRRKVTPEQALRALGLPLDPEELLAWCLAWVTRAPKPLAGWAL